MVMSEKQLMTIGKVARAAGVSTHTLRYYEREGIMGPTVRNGAGYRLYDADALERLRFIRSAQAIGFTLDDIRTLGRLDEESGQCCQAEVRRLLELRLAEVEEKMKDLKRVQESLGLALDRCRRSNGECEVLKEIGPAKSKRS